MLDKIKKWQKTRGFSKKLKYLRLSGLAIAIFIMVLITTIPLRLTIAYLQAPQPQAILTLGAWIDRELFAAQFASTRPNLEIWVSSGTPPETASAVFRAFNIPDSRVHIDRRAVDTVTNFTSLIGDFKSRQIRHLYLITSDYHMARAKAIATIILGSQSIAFTPLGVPSQQPSESPLRIARDVGRSIIWVVTGRTGASLNPSLEASR